MFLKIGDSMVNLETVMMIVETAHGRTPSSPTKMTEFRFIGDRRSERCKVTANVPLDDVFQAIRFGEPCVEVPVRRLQQDKPKGGPVPDTQTTTPV
jgi:hypothetical protein